MIFQDASKVPKIGIRWKRGGAALARNTSVSLGDHFASFIDEQVKSGRYGSASDVIRAGLRLLEDRDAHLVALQTALIEGETSGPSTPFDVDRFLSGKRERRSEQ